MVSPSGFLFLVGWFIAALEMVFARLPFRPYFAFGIPIVREVIDVTGQAIWLPNPERLRQFLKENRCPVKLRPLGNRVVAFRETSVSTFSDPFTPALHGTFASEPGSSTVIVTGYLNWSIPAIALGFLAIGEYFVFSLLCLYLFRSYSPRRETYTLVARAVEGYLAFVPDGSVRG